MTRGVEQRGPTPDDTPHDQPHEHVYRCQDCGQTREDAGDGFPALGAEEACCADCRQPYTCWYADNDLWNAVMRDVVWLAPEPFLCARCFLVRAERVTEIARVTWPEVPSRRDRERATVTASQTPATADAELASPLSDDNAQTDVQDDIHRMLDDLDSAAPLSDAPAQAGER